MDDGFRARADARRLAMVGGTAKSFAELEIRGLEFWASTSLEVRLHAVYTLVSEHYLLEGPDATPPRFDGSTYGVGTFEG
jgi:hypothetical protein